MDKTLIDIIIASYTSQTLQWQLIPDNWIVTFQFDVHFSVLPRHLFYWF